MAINITLHDFLLEQKIEALLKNEKTGSLIIRFSETCPKGIVLTLKMPQEIVHYMFMKEDASSSMEILSLLKNAKFGIVERHLPRGNKEFVSTKKHSKELPRSFYASPMKVLLKLDIVEKECAICFDGLRDIALDPCGHIFCHKCSNMITECPVCRIKIQNRRKVYL